MVVVVVAVVFVRHQCRRCRLRRRLLVVATVAQTQEKVTMSFQFGFLKYPSPRWRSWCSELPEFILRVGGVGFTFRNGDTDTIIYMQSVWEGDFMPHTFKSILYGR